MRSVATAKKPMQHVEIRPRVKMWLELAGEHTFCPGLCQILRAVEAAGSIKEAAVSIGRSYRFVWGKIKRVEQALGHSLVESRVGGSHDQRSVLSPAGQILVAEFEALRQRLFEIVDGEFANRLKNALERIEEQSKSSIEATPSCR